MKITPPTEKAKIDGKNLTLVNEVKYLDKI